MILLVCGGRNYRDYHALDSAIKGLPQQPSMIIQGGAPGADQLAKQWAKKNSIHCAEVPAMWNEFGNKAGPLRNKAMLLLKPDMCLAMPGGTGTDNMIKQCVGVGIKTYALTEEPVKYVQYPSDYS